MAFRYESELIKTKHYSRLAAIDVDVQFQGKPSKAGS